MMTRRGHLFVLSAPSGAGKSTLIDRAIREIPNMWHSISATTRQPRDYEKEGVHYYFIEREAFQEKIEKDSFLEWAQVHGEFYGTPAAGVDNCLAEGKDVIMDLDVQGAIQTMQRRPEAITVFIMPPSIEVLRKRIEGRKSESEESLKLRLLNAQKEMDQRGRYEHLIVNDVFDDAYRELVAIIENTRKSGGENTRKSGGENTRKSGGEGSA
ncbi:MAG: guanylate kinase [bacterium]